MTNFKIDVDHDHILGDLADFTPYQPLTNGIEYVSTRHALDGTIINEEPFVVFTFPILTEAQYQALLTQAGITGALNAKEVTIYAQDINYVWQLFNGEAVRPEKLRRRGFHFYDVPLLVRNLRDTA